MAYRAQFGSLARERLYSREAFKAHQAGRGIHPICPHCDRPVLPTDAWDESHIAVPKCFGGNLVGVGHRECNQADNHHTVTPAASKARSVWKRHVGITGPGLGRNPMRFGRRSDERKTMRGDVVPRLSIKQKHEEFLRRRHFVEVEDFSEPLEVQP